MNVTDKDFIPMVEQAMKKLAGMGESRLAFRYWLLALNRIRLEYKELQLDKAYAKHQRMCARLDEDCIVAEFRHTTLKNL